MPHWKCTFLCKRVNMDTPCSQSAGSCTLCLNQIWPREVDGCGTMELCSDSADMADSIPVRAVCSLSNWSLCLPMVPSFIINPQNVFFLSWNLLTYLTLYFIYPSFGNHDQLVEQLKIFQDMTDSLDPFQFGLWPGCGIRNCLVFLTDGFKLVFVYPGHIWLWISPASAFIFEQHGFQTLTL